MAVARNLEVFCMESKTRNIGINLNFHPDKKAYRKKAVRTELLRLVCKETMDYKQLCQYYQDAKKGRTNPYFVEVIPVTTTCFLNVNDEGEILLFRYQDRIRAQGKRLLPWDYPHTITRIGHANRCAVEQIAEDYRTAPTIDFLLQYQAGAQCRKNHVVSNRENGFEIDGILRINIDHHISLRIMNGLGSQEEQYFADTWWYEKEEILRDFLSMSYLDFSQKYHSI